MDITQLLAFSVKNKASDLHLSAGLPPMIRVHGDVRRINVEPLDHKQVHAMVYDIMNDTQRKHYEEFLECDFSFEIEGLARFRVNAFNQNRGAAAVFRTIPSKILTLEQLNAPRIFADLALKPRGLVLVTGPTGSGKSTTLAAMIDWRNEQSYGHIITIEDPVEFVHPHKNCVVTQREVGLDTDSWEAALKNILRQSPDVILMGEIRDRETAQVAMEAALTGHLVLSTLHTTDVVQTLQRIISFYPPYQREELRIIGVARGAPEARDDQALRLGALEPRMLGDDGRVGLERHDAGNRWTAVDPNDIDSRAVGDRLINELSDSVRHNRCRGVRPTADRDGRILAAARTIAIVWGTAMSSCTHARRAKRSVSSSAIQ